jgi:hypothetical protein
MVFSECSRIKSGSIVLILIRVIREVGQISIRTESPVDKELRLIAAMDEP